LATGAIVGCSTGVTIITRLGVVDPEATGGRIAPISGTRIIVSAIHQLGSDAHSIRTVVVLGTRIAIVAGSDVGGEDASHSRVTGIISA
jgi:hypothetical protein